MKMIDGNKPKRDKPKTHIKVLQIHRGNSDCKNKEHLITQTLNEHQSDKAIVGEVNLPAIDKKVREDKTEYTSHTSYEWLLFIPSNCHDKEKTCNMKG